MPDDDPESLMGMLAPDTADSIITGKVHARRGHDDYSTPPHYAERVRRALGGSIGCDPASGGTEDNGIIRAEQYYTHGDNGLDTRRKWHSPVYLNPPSVSREEFLSRAAQEVRRGCEMVVCLNLKHLCAGYAQPLIRRAAALHVPRGRPAFLHGAARRRSESPTDGRIFLYFGRNSQRFADEFAKDAGWTAVCIEVSAPGARGYARVVPPC